MELVVIVGLAMLLGAAAGWLVSARWHQRRRAELVQFAQAWEYARYAGYLSAHRYPHGTGAPFPR
ncbi:hypothetical protein DL991_25585 [Amycolatopsis sp. WAC 01375]|uniref:LapA family protein n=1 Tax=unclassified Amycolatopsis TaxID=2618356 RepID=UPI000F78830D|nr:MULTISPECIES: LapA family protein [unclassified Amycolatopsis]RSM76565.1 hypothetical protein DL991_25585 [Amycolatopsis sp. WAC 01375]RSN33212.1 hypothetical protein DL990_14510 [Amycolatopsis sp. WAC 01416]